MNQQNHSGQGNNIIAENVFIESIPKLSSDLTMIVNTLSKKIFFTEGESEKDPKLSFSPTSKIEYNNVKRFKIIIDNFKHFVGKLSSIYKEFDAQGTNKTYIVLENIKLSYLKEKSNLIEKNVGKNEIEIIRENADNLIDAVEKNLLTEIKSSANIEVSSESVNLSLQIILIDAFIRCKILEEPI